ncbi:MAG: hypothetical protein O2901_12410 [Verrucomicrobia bacterium]|nr:hypothetical protein [Verrucomicrobiota bacterium]
MKNADYIERYEDITGQKTNAQTRGELRQWINHGGTLDHFRPTGGSQTDGEIRLWLDHGGRLNSFRHSGVSAPLANLTTPPGGWGSFQR